MDRRQFLRWSSIGLVSSTLPSCHPLYHLSGSRLESVGHRSPAFSVIPVVGDGHWIWRDPPVGQTGYLEPRPYSLSIGIELQGTGEATDLKATTPVPVAHPEQKIDKLEIETEGCEASVHELAPGMAQLVLSAAELAKGQIIRPWPITS